MSAFTDLFRLNNEQIVANKKNRFVRLLHATADGTLFARPKMERPPYVAHLDYASPPIWNAMQSSYEDVEKELNLMRSHHLDKRILFVGGDGLSIIRINHLLHARPDLYLDSAPFIIPVQGEAPHGVFHIMHGGWRMFQRFIRAAAIGTLGMELSSAVMDDPNVKNFNKQIYALWWMTRACAEYLLHLSQTIGAIDIDLVDEFIAACECNVDLAYVVHFLYDFAFLVLDFKQAVRVNDSKHLDVLWREFYAIGRTGTANKTQYVPMSIMRIFWSEALSPQLAALYHKLRAIPMSERTHVGWDTPIEWLNLGITEGVSKLVSESRIANCIENYALLESNYRMLLDATQTTASVTGKMKEMDSNVNAMKGWLMDQVGADWNTATRENENSNLNLGRGMKPWMEIREAMCKEGRDSVTSHVARHVRGLTNTFFAFDD